MSNVIAFFVAYGIIQMILHPYTIWKMYKGNDQYYQIDFVDSRQDLLELENKKLLVENARLAIEANKREYR